MQSLIDSMSAIARATRSDYHVTLLRIINIAEQASGNVYFADGGIPGKALSYRGYYSDLAFSTENGEKKASTFLEQCQCALGQTYEGYKGGEFLMDKDTPLWRAEFGCTGDAIVSAVIAKNGDLELHCLDVKD